MLKRLSQRVPRLTEELTKEQVTKAYNDTVEQFENDLKAMKKYFAIIYDGNKPEDGSTVIGALTLIYKKVSDAERKGFFRSLKQAWVLARMISKYVLPLRKKVRYVHDNLDKIYNTTQDHLETFRGLAKTERATHFQKLEARTTGFMEDFRDMIDYLSDLEKYLTATGKVKDAKSFKQLLKNAITVTAKGVKEFDAMINKMYMDWKGARRRFTKTETDELTDVSIVELLSEIEAKPESKEEIV